MVTYRLDLAMPVMASDVNVTSINTEVESTDINEFVEFVNQLNEEYGVEIALANDFDEKDVDLEDLKEELISVAKEQQAINESLEKLPSDAVISRASYPTDWKSKRATVKTSYGSMKVDASVKYTYDDTRNKFLSAITGDADSVGANDILEYGGYFYSGYVSDNVLEVTYSGTLKVKENGVTRYTVSSYKTVVNFYWND